MMENNELWAGLYLQRSSEIDGRKAWFYLISSSIGNIAVVEYEQTDKSIKRYMFDDDYDKAEYRYEHIVMDMMKGRR